MLPGYAEAIVWCCQGNSMMLWPDCDTVHLTLANDLETVDQLHVLDWLSHQALQFDFDIIWKISPLYALPIPKTWKIAPCWYRCWENKLSFICPTADIADILLMMVRISPTSLHRPCWFALLLHQLTRQPCIWMKTFAKQSIVTESSLNNFSHSNSIKHRCAITLKSYMCTCVANACL